MLRFTDLVAITAAAGIITFGFATAEARDVKIQKPEAVKAVAAAAPVTAVEKAVVGQAAAERIVQIPACARKVKVVYAGYGESDRASCPAGPSAN